MAERYERYERYECRVHFRGCVIFALVAIFFVAITRCDYDPEYFDEKGSNEWHRLRLKRNDFEIKECTANEFRCDYFSCVKKSLTCNGAKDCLNGVDETLDICSKNKCKDDEFRCEYGGCVSKNALCDGYHQCADESDESWHICANFTCPPKTFRCVQGVCLDKGRLCDGGCTCHGCGDETKELCSNNICPPNKFRCDYGGCLDDDQLCDGFPNCRDGADENVALCGNRTCTGDRFRCSNGLCIPSFSVCDGHCHCPNCQEESAEYCVNNICPRDKGRIFRCDYGACLYMGHVCNGVNNCADGSDEHESICKRKQPQNLTTCTVPAAVANRFHTLQCPSGECETRPGKRVEQFARATFSCADGYHTEGGNGSFSVCVDGYWSPPIPQCERKCQPLTPVNEELTCFRHRRGSPISCETILLPGAVVHVKCKEAYRPPGLKKAGVSTVCDKDGTWSNKLYKCEPDCGKAIGSGQNLIANGSPETAADSPWHVAIYSTAGYRSPQLICGATIVSDNLIVSAAHCFRDGAGNTLDESNFEAVVAKFNRAYNSTDSNFMKRYKIRKIFHPSRDYLTKGYEVYQGDIALLQPTRKITFNRHVVPACIDWSASGAFTPTQTFNGKLVGWGQDASGKPSDTLLAAFMPYLSKSRCLQLVNVDYRSSITEDKFCAGGLAGVGARPGDSGGGLLFRDPHLNSYSIRGIVSSKDTSNTSIATFTDVALYLDWIETVQNEISGE